VVRKENDQSLVQWRNEITQGLNRNQTRDLHFKNLNHSQRKFAAQCLGEKKFGIAVAMSNKLTLMENQRYFQLFKQKNHLHNYLARWLLERVSRCIKVSHTSETPCRAKVVFSRRGGMNYDDFRAYLELIKDGREVRYSPGRIDWDVIDPNRIEALDHSKRAGLQIADVATSSFFHAVEPDVFGNHERTYADLLRPRVIHMPRAPVYDCGVTHIPKLKRNSPLNDAQRQFFDSWTK
jgi:hypothetical protein